MLSNNNISGLMYIQQGKFLNPCRKLSYSRSLMAKPKSATNEESTRQISESLTQDHSNLKMFKSCF